MIANVFEYEALDARVLDDCRLVMEAEMQKALRDEQKARIEEHMAKVRHGR